MFWHHNLFKQTRDWILKPQTHTHHHTTQKRSIFTGGISFIFRLPTRSPEPVEQTVFVLVRPGGNSVSVTVFPAGQRDITLDHPRGTVQIQNRLSPRDTHHTACSAQRCPLAERPAAPQPLHQPSPNAARFSCPGGQLCAGVRAARRGRHPPR